MEYEKLHMDMNEVYSVNLFTTVMAINDMMIFNITTCQHHVKLAPACNNTIYIVTG